MVVAGEKPIAATIGGSSGTPWYPCCRWQHDSGSAQRFDSRTHKPCALKFVASASCAQLSSFRAQALGVCPDPVGEQHDGVQRANHGPDEEDDCKRVLKHDYDRDRAATHGPSVGLAVC